MNILPMVFALLMIIAGVFSSFFHQHIHVHLIHQSTLARAHLERRSLIVLRRNAFNQIPIKKTSQPTPGKTGAKKPHHRHPLSPLSKLSLASLFSDEPSEKLYTIALSLLKRLYPDQPALEPLFKEMIQAGKKRVGEAPELSLADLFPENAQQQQLYYTLLQGTNYQAHGEGFPPLSDYFTLTPTTSIANFHEASLPLLEALFGPAHAKQLLELEKQQGEDSQRKSPFLTKSDVNALVQDLPLLDLLSFEIPKKNKSPTVLTHRSTRMVARS